MGETKVGLELYVRDRASRELQSFSGIVGKTTSSLKSLVGGAMALAGVGGLTYMIKSTMNAIDATAKLSDRLGIATEDLLGLQYGAKLAGVGTETLNKSLETFNQRLGEVRMGTGEAKDALKLLGLSANDLVMLSPSEALGLVSDRMSKLSTQADKAAVANKLFGRSSREMANFLAEGSAGIRKSQRELELLGGTFSRFDAAQVEAANDALERMGVVFKGIWQKALIQMAPVVEVLATRFNEAAMSGEGMGVRMVKVMEVVTESIMAVAEAIDGIIRATGRVISPLETEKNVHETEKSAQEQYKMIMGDKDLFAFERVPVKGFLGGKLPQEPKDKLLYDKLLKSTAVDKGFLPKERDIHEIFAKFYRDIRIETAAGQLEESKLGNMRIGGGPGYAGVVDIEQSDAVDKLTDSIKRQVEVLDMVNSGRAGSIKLAEAMIAIEQACGAKTQISIDKIAEYGKTLDDLNRAEQVKQVNEVIAKLEAEAQALDLVIAGRAKSVEQAQMMIQIESLCGEAINQTTDMMNHYQEALDSVDAKNAELEIRKMTDALQEELEVAKQYEQFGPNTEKIVKFHGWAEKARGKGTPESIEMTGAYAAQLKELDQVQKRRDAITAMDEMNQRMISEIEMVGRIGQSWEHARDRTEFARMAAIRYGEGTLEAAAAMEQFDMRIEQLEMAQRWMEVARGMEDAFAGAFEQILFEGGKFGDVMQSLFQQIAMDIMRIQAIRPISESLAPSLTTAVSGIFGGIFGGGKSGGGSEAGRSYLGGVFHSGGVVGEGRVHRSVSAWLFEGAPRLHEGLAPSEYPAILERGETVLPAGVGVSAPAGMSAPTIIINNSGTALRQEAAPKFNGRQWVIEVIADDYHRGGKMRELIAGHQA